MHKGESSPPPSEYPDSTFSGTPEESFQPEFRNVLSGLQAVQSGRLAVYLSLVSLTVILILSILGIYLSKSAEDALHKRMDEMVASQSGVIAEPMRYGDYQRIHVILRAILVDDHVVGVAVYDELQNPLAAAGDANLGIGHGPEIHSAEIGFKTNGSSEQIGRLIIYRSDINVTAENRERWIVGIIVSLLLIVASVFSALVANWWVIAVPLGRLRWAIALAEKNNANATVDWSGKDEFGKLIMAFSRTQAQLPRNNFDSHADQKELERQVEDRTRKLRMARDDAETANHIKTQFLQRMSHELRTPLNAILGFSDLIRMSDSLSLSAQQRTEYAEDINNSARFLLDIVNDLLDISRIEAEAYKPEDNWIDPVAIVVECLTMLRIIAQSKEIELVNNLPKKLPTLVGDRRMIKQVFLNILSNALKFTDHGGRVKVSVTVTSTGDMNFCFTDNGRGIAPGEMETIFQPLNRIIDPLGTREKGTGLGLPLAKALIELHGGDFTIESELNESTTVVVTLPAKRILAEASIA